ncbi:MAG TPA: hypothetical protein VM661_14035 [Candidatus Sulfotelmatobacter sp.]|nr:hypothetical protein [Candidatus Sulfotelmatobacter sp.]
MIDAIVNDDVLKIEGTDAFQASGIDTEQIRVRTTLMMGIYAALRAKPMLCRHRVKLIPAELLRTRYDPKFHEFCGNDNGAAHPAIRTGATACRTQTVGEPHLKAHAPTVASSVDPWCV